ncbi:MAG TPA: MerR family transcriptional regulator [Actinoplanes sp.]|nr:MerR family transcriptional regulator [Actinoplanes sp.]
MWTLDELVERVRRALAAEYPGAPNGRVRDLPDRRAIRWYTTTGLVDRPLGMRGRTALYGNRHLLQLVALKRRQAEGRTLAEIQAELAGASDDALTRVARVPESLLDAAGGPADDGPVRTRFWATPPEQGEPEQGEPEQGEKAALPERAADRTPAVQQGEKTAQPERAPLERAADRTPAAQQGEKAAPIGGVALGHGAILVLPGLPTEDERRAIAAAARPLMDLLRERGLLEEGSRS